MSNPAKTPAWKVFARELPEEYRPIRKQDVRAPFHCNHPVMGRFTLKDFYTWSLDRGAIVLIREVNGEPGVVLMGYIEEKQIFVEKIARDAACPKGYALPMLMVVELLAQKLSKEALHLEALGEELAWRYEEHGYERYGSPYVDRDEPEWGILVPMRKLLP